MGEAGMCCFEAKGRELIFLVWGSIVTIKVEHIKVIYAAQIYIFF